MISEGVLWVELNACMCSAPAKAPLTSQMTEQPRGSASGLDWHANDANLPCDFIPFTTILKPNRRSHYIRPIRCNATPSYSFYTDIPQMPMKGARQISGTRSGVKTSLFFYSTCWIWTVCRSPLSNRCRGRSRPTSTPGHHSTTISSHSMLRAPWQCPKHFVRSCRHASSILCIHISCRLVEAKLEMEMGSAKMLALLLWTQVWPSILMSHFL